MTSYQLNETLDPELAYVTKVEKNNNFSFAWARYFARIIDLQIFSVIFSLILGVILFLFNKKITHLETLLSVPLIFLCWVPIESLLLRFCGNTPGKWLLKIKLRDSTDNKLSMTQALSRSFKVYLRGCWLGIPFIMILPFIFSYTNFLKLGITSWDKEGKISISHYPLNWIRITAAILLFVSLNILLRM